MRIDINCDLGESFGNYRIGNDEVVFPYITSANIACGFHGGDPYQIEKTIDLAIQHDVQIGAHPGYPDLQGFGRRKMEIPLVELASMIKYQVGALKSMVESKGATLAYVKPHGALYNSLATNGLEAKAVVRSVKELDPNLSFMGLAGSHVRMICEEQSVSYIAEAFADRRYTSSGQLVSRTLPDAVIHAPEQAAEQVLTIVMDHQVQSIDHQMIPMKADSVCIHGDNPEAKNILEAIHHLMNLNNITIQSMPSP